MPRGSSLGKGRFKILAFDLTVFLASVMRKTDFPNFLMHDGVFHAIAHKTRIKFLNYINTKLNSMDDVQYIITVNEDEIIFPESEGVTIDLDFDLEEKILILSKTAGLYVTWKRVWLIGGMVHSRSFHFKYSRWKPEYFCVHGYRVSISIQYFPASIYFMKK